MGKEIYYSGLTSTGNLAYAFTNWPNRPDLTKQVLKADVERLDEISKMPEYQWKLTIVERNLLLSNWVKLIPEAQAQMLEEADELMEKLPLFDRRRLLTYLETLQYHIEADLQQKINKILSSQLSLV